MTRTSLFRLAGVLAVGLLLVGCSTPAPPPPASGSSTDDPAQVPVPSPSPAEPTVAPPMLEGRLTCGSPDLEFGPERLQAPPADLTGDGPAAALREFLANGTEVGLPSEGWRIVVAEPARVAFVAASPDGWHQVSLVMAGGGRWEPWEWGSCRLALVLPDGLGLASWRIDPAQPAAPESTTVHVLATEVACASGHPPLDRLLAPIVLESDHAVTIILRVRIRPGDQECPSNPEAAVAVALPAPLGPRRLFDGSEVPPAERPAR